jgi:drug/metabolite transporter (DMT)-like permease
MNEDTTPRAANLMRRGVKVARSGLGLTDLLLLGVIIVWGTNFVVLKRALSELSPMTVNAVRFFISSSLLLALVARRRVTNPLPRQDTLRVALAGVVGYGLAQVCMLLGLSLTSASQTALLSATMPIFVALLSHLAGTERLSRRAWLGSLICFGGITLVVGAPSMDDRLRSLLGSVLILASAFGWSAAMVMNTPVLRRASASQVTAVMTLTGTAVLILVAIPDMAREAWSGVTVSTWVGLAYSGVFSLAVGTVIWNRGVRLIGPSRTAIYSNLTPVAAALTAWLFLGERFTPMQFVGATIILAGLYLVRTARIR